MGAWRTFKLNALCDSDEIDADMRRLYQAIDFMTGEGKLGEEAVTRTAVDAYKKIAALLPQGLSLSPYLERLGADPSFRSMKFAEYERLKGRLSTVDFMDTLRSFWNNSNSYFVKF